MSENHYYPFGMNLHGLEEYDAQSVEPLEENMYQYNGKERDVSLGLHWYDYGARQYDAQLGRFHVVDRFSEKYFPLTTYQYTANNPVNFIDVNGDSIWVQSGGKRYYWGESEGTYGFLNKDGEHADIDDEFVDKVTNDLNKLMEGGETGNGLVKDLASRSENVLIQKSNKNSEGEGFSGEFDDGTPFIYQSRINFSGVSDLPGIGESFVALGHEMAHSQDRFNGTLDVDGIWLDKAYYSDLSKSIPNAEKNATHIENKIRAENGLDLRESYIYNSRGKPSHGQIIDKDGRSLFHRSDDSRRDKYRKVKKEERYTYE
jgi:RHS repeat-associated protein